MPDKVDQWYLIDDAKGCELVVAFARNEPLASQGIKEFEQVIPFANKTQAVNTYRFDSQSINNDEFDNNERILKADFIDRLKSIATSFDGLVLLHAQ